MRKSANAFEKQAGASPPCTIQVAIIFPIKRYFTVATASKLWLRITWSGYPAKRDDANISRNTSGKTLFVAHLYQLLPLLQILLATFWWHQMTLLKTDKVHRKEHENAKCESAVHLHHHLNGLPELDVTGSYALLQYCPLWYLIHCINPLDNAITQILSCIPLRTGVHYKCLKIVIVFR